MNGKDWESEPEIRGEDCPSEIQDQIDQLTSLRAHPGSVVMCLMIISYGCFIVSLFMPEGISRLPGLALLLDLRDAWPHFLYGTESRGISISFTHGKFILGMIGLFTILMNFWPLFLIPLLCYQRVWVKMLLSLISTGVVLLGIPLYLILFNDIGLSILISAPSFWGLGYSFVAVTCWVSLLTLLKQQNETRSHIMS